MYTYSNVGREYICRTQSASLYQQGPLIACREEVNSNAAAAMPGGSCQLAFPQQQHTDIRKIVTEMTHQQSCTTPSAKQDGEHQPTIRVSSMIHDINFVCIESASAA